MSPVAAAARAAAWTAASAACSWSDSSACFGGIGTEFGATAAILWGVSLDRFKTQSSDTPRTSHRFLFLLRFQVLNLSSRSSWCGPAPTRHRGFAQRCHPHWGPPVTLLSLHVSFHRRKTCRTASFLHINLRRFGSRGVYGIGSKCVLPSADFWTQLAETT